jgi:diguanylate cyclase (GGDEF)-like protein/PAS domain S-box-containing protein
MGMDANNLEISRQSALAAENQPAGLVFFKQLFDSLSDGVYIVDKERKILYWNRGAQALTGYSQDEAAGRYCNSGVFNHTDGAGCKLCEGNCPLLKVIETQQPQYKRMFFRHKDRRCIAVAMHCMPLKNERDEIVGVVGMFRDASEAAALDDAYNKLRELSEKDALTGTTNRRQLDKIIPDQLRLLKRSGIPFSVILLDIDRFKQIKKTLCRGEGDEILVHFAQILRRQCRGSDIIGRFKEGMFLILLRQQNLELAVQMAERLRIAVSTSRQLRRNLTASLGVTEATFDDTTAGVMKRVTQALHRARTCGGNRVESLEPETVA